MTATTTMKVKVGLLPETIRIEDPPAVHITALIVTIEDERDVDTPEEIEAFHLLVIEITAAASTTTTIDDITMLLPMSLHEQELCQMMMVGVEERPLLPHPPPVARPKPPALALLPRTTIPKDISKEAKGL